MPKNGLTNNLQSISLHKFKSRFSLALDGTDDYGYIYMNQYDVYNSDSPQAISCSFWFKKDAWEESSENGKIIGDAGNQMSFGAEEYVHSGNSELRLLALYGGALHEIYLKNTTYVAGTTGWIHLLFTLDPTVTDGTNTSTIYMNGVSIDASLVRAGDGSEHEVDVGSSAQLGTSVLIGNDRGLSGRHMLCNLGDMALWNTTLSAADALAIYNSGKPNDLKKSSSYDTDRTSNLLHYWRMGSGGGDNVRLANTGIIADQVNPTLQDSIWDADASQMVIGGNYLGTHSDSPGGTKGDDTYAWKPEANTTASNDNGSLKIVADGGVGYCIQYLKGTYDLSSNLASKTIYVLEFDAKIDGGTGKVQMRVFDDLAGSPYAVTNQYDITNSSYERYVIHFAALGSNQSYMQFSIPDGQTLHAKNFSLQRTNGAPIVLNNTASNIVEEDAP